METLINTFSLTNHSHTGEGVGKAPVYPKWFHKPRNSVTETVILICFLNIMHFIIYYPKVQKINWMTLGHIKEEYTTFFQKSHF